MKVPELLGRPWVRALVLAVSLACLVWVVWPIWRHGRELRESVHGPELASAIAAGALAYAVVSVLSAFAWWWLAGIYGQRTSARAGYVIFARSQLAKYLPSNTLHFVTRQLLGRRAGLSHQALVASSFLEIGGQLFAAFLVGAVGVSVMRVPGAGGFTAWPWALALGVGCLAAWPALDLALRRAPWTAKWMSGLPHLSVGRTLQVLGPALGLYLVFFAVTSLLLIALVPSSWGGSSAELGSLIWLFPAAWAAGLVTVGAPAGIGVREAVLTLGLEPFVGPAPAAAMALAFRLVTTGGDLVTAGAGWWLGDREEPTGIPEP